MAQTRVERSSMCNTPVHLLQGQAEVASINTSSSSGPVNIIHMFYVFPLSPLPARVFFSNVRKTNEWEGGGHNEKSFMIRAKSSRFPLERRTRARRRGIDRWELINISNYNSPSDGNIKTSINHQARLPSPKLIESWKKRRAIYGRQMWMREAGTRLLCDINENWNENFEH